MKKIIYFLAFLCQFTHSQTKKSTDGFMIEPVFRINAVKTNQLGDSFLAKANQPDLGFGIELGFLKYKKITSTLDYNYNYFSVTDIEKAGNINSTRFSSFGAKILYEIDVYKKFSLQPYLGIGNPTLNFKSSSTSFGKQNGIDYKIGFYTNYNLNENVAFSFGTEYNWAEYIIETVPEFVDFYKSSNAIKFILGVRFH